MRFDAEPDADIESEADAEVEDMPPRVEVYRHDGGYISYQNDVFQIDVVYNVWHITLPFSTAYSGCFSSFKNFHTEYCIIIQYIR